MRKYSPKWNALTDDEVRVTAAALDHYIKLGPEQSEPIKLARKLVRELHEIIRLFKVPTE